MYSFEKKLKECVEKINRIDLQLSDQIEWYNNHEMLQLKFNEITSLDVKNIDYIINTSLKTLEIYTDPYNIYKITPMEKMQGKEPEGKNFLEIM